MDHASRAARPQHHTEVSAPVPAPELPRHTKPSRGGASPPPHSAGGAGVEREIRPGRPGFSFPPARSQPIVILSITSNEYPGKETTVLYFEKSTATEDRVLFGIDFCIKKSNSPEYFTQAEFSS
uniref:Uncharacterized protein n=1 Tax=Oryza nivara TaxID=4536 RepID=A0A0E0IAU3_ORYNI